MALSLSERVSKMKPSGMVRIFQAIEQMEGVLNLSIGEPDFNTDPEIIHAAANAALDGATHYPPVQGYLDLREAVCRYWDRHYGLKQTPEEVFISVGAIQIPHLVLDALLNPGDEVLLFEPYFPPYVPQIRAHGGVPVSISTSPSNNFAPTREELERAVTSRTRGLVVNSPSNPGGQVLTRDQLEVIADFAKEKDLFVLSDEIYESLVFEGAHHPMACLENMKDRTVTIGGLSKSYCMTGWRIGYMMAPSHVVQAVTLISGAQNHGVNTLAQKGALYALDFHDSKIQERCEIFAERMRKVRERLERMKGICCAPAQGAFYLFPDVSGTGLTGEEFAWRLLREAKVGTVPGGAFGRGVGGYIRIACTQSMDTLMKAMDKMEAFTESL